MHIDPWGASQYQDYARLRDAFGISPFGPEEWGVFEDPSPLLRRGVVFGHRDFERVADAVAGRDPWSVMTGLMPSGPMHLGHKMVLDQVVAHQDQGADVHVAVADLEAVAARNLSLGAAQELAVDQYVLNYLALGLDPERAEVYFQSRRHRVKDLAHRFALKVNWSQMQALYGFSGTTTMAHALAPLVQAADILHVQGDGLGPRPVLVPVGVDQDPHIRLTRDVAKAFRGFSLQPTKDGHLGVYVRGEADPVADLDLAESVLRDLGYGELARKDGYREIVVRGARGQDRRRIDLALARAEAGRGDPAFLRPSATFHRFMTGLTGDKMSSSRPESGVFLTDSPAEAKKKVMRSITGGRDTAEEQRRLGADPDACPVYELYLYHVAQDDAHLQTVRDECTGGVRLCGGCKGEAAELIGRLLTEHHERRDEVAHRVQEIVRTD